MGHEIRYVSFSEDRTKEYIAAECDAIATRDGEYHHGLNRPIKFFSCSPLLNEEAAEEYIKERDTVSCGAYAVRYYVYKDITSKKLEDLETRRRDTREKYYAVSNKNHFKDLKSAYVGCKECGSRINAKYIRNNRCPVCTHDLRPETVLKQIKSLDDKVSSLNDQIKEETERLQEKAKKNAKVFWLVKFEYHV